MVLAQLVEHWIPLKPRKHFSGLLCDRLNRNHNCEDHIFISVRILCWTSNSTEDWASSVGFLVQVLVYGHFRVGVFACSKLEHEKYHEIPFSQNISYEQSWQNDSSPFKLICFVLDVRRLFTFHSFFRYNQFDKRYTLAFHLTQACKSG